MCPFQDFLMHVYTDSLYLLPSYNKMCAFTRFRREKERYVLSYCLRSASVNALFGRNKAIRSKFDKTKRLIQSYL